MFEALYQFIKSATLADSTAQVLLQAPKTPAEFYVKHPKLMRAINPGLAVALEDDLREALRRRA